MFQGFVLIDIRYPGVSKYENSWFWEPGTRPKIPKSKKWIFLGSPISKSKIDQTKMDQNNTPELLNLLFA